MPGITDEIDSMLKMYENFDTSPDELTTEGVATDNPSTDAPATSAPDDSTATDAPSTEAPEESPYEKRIRGLEEQISQMKQKPSTKAPSTEAPIDELDFLGDGDIDDILADRSALNKLLNKVFLKGAEMTKNQLAKSKTEIFQSLPTMVKTNIVTLESLKKTSEDFYKNNPDLEPFKKVVATMFEEAASDHPDWPHSKLLEESEKRTREKLGLKKSNQPVQKPDDKKSPPLPRKRSQQRTQQQTTPSDPLLAELEAMDKVLWR
jgi:hypothetical protein